MKTILKIGYRKYLLPKGADFGKLLKSLGEAMPVESKWEKDREVYFPDARENRGEIEITMVPDQNVLVTRRKLLAEKSGPEANGEDITSPD